MDPRYESGNLYQTAGYLGASNMDVPVNTQYQDLVESLKVNKEVNGLAKYVGEHVLPVLSTQDGQRGD